MLRAVLDLPVEHIVQHLSAKDCQTLRSTCKLLRHHAAVVAGVSAVKQATTHLAALRKLTGLCRLSVYRPLSLFDLHHLYSLTKLTSVEVSMVPVVDLQPLSFISSLRRLELCYVHHYASLCSLQQLNALNLDHTSAMPAVLQLSALTCLALCEGSLAGSLSRLDQLAALSIADREGHWRAQWTDGEIATFVAAVAGLPALTSLTCAFGLLPPPFGLVQLTALQICCDGDELPESMHDLRQLTGLVKLGITNYVEQPVLLSDSVTTLYLESVDYDLGPDTIRVPYLAGCSRLEHIMLIHETEITIRVKELPPRALTLWLEQGSDLNPDGVFLESRLAKVLRVHRVKRLTLDSDPATLEAECE